MEEIIQEALSKGVEMHVASEFELAGQMYGSVIKLQPHHADANHNMGLLKVDMGNDLDALPYLQTALEADTSIAQFWLSYVKVLIKLDRVDEATRILNLAKENGIDGDEFAELHRQLDAPLTIDVINHPSDDKVSAAPPNILDTIKLDKALRLAKKNLDDGVTEEAKLIYQDILARFPKNKKAIDGIRALTGRAIGKGSQIQDPPQDQLQYIIDLYTQGQLQQALGEASQLLQQFPNSVGLYNIQGVINAGLGLLDAAVESYKKSNYNQA
jgi:tetratricopeptide (TPR) repeat protein